MIIWDTPPIVGGTVLIIERVESQNFDTGVAGWALFANGDAEFNSVLIRGSLVTGVPPDPRIEIPDGAVQILFYSESDNETSPGSITNDRGGGSNNRFVITSSGSSESVGSPATPSIELSPNTFLRDFTQGAAITMAAREYNLGDGDLHIDADNLAFGTASDNNNDTSAQTNSIAYVALTGTFGNPFGTIPAPDSGRLMVHISCDMSPSNVGGLCLTSFQLRETDAVGPIITAVSDTQAILLQAAVAGDRANFGRTFFVSGVPTGGTIFFQMLHRVTNVATIGTFRRRFITVQPML